MLPVEDMEDDCVPVDPTLFLLTYPKLWGTRTLDEEFLSLLCPCDDDTAFFSRLDDVGLERPPVT